MLRSVFVALALCVSLSACSSGDGGGGPSTTRPSSESGGLFGKKVLDEPALESSDGVAKILVEEYHLSPPISVDCPPNQEAKSGHRFTCTARFGGTDHVVDIKVLDDQGTYEVGTPREN